MQQSSATLKNVGIGLQKIVACSHSSSQCLLVSVSSLLFHEIFIQALYIARGEMYVRTSG